MRSWCWVLFLAAAVPVRGQTLTLRDAAASALATHPALLVAESGVQRAGAVLMESRAARLPGAALDGSLTRFEEPMVVAPLHGFDPQSPPVFDRTLGQGSLSVTYLAFDGGARGARISRASAQQEAASAVSSSVRQSLIADAARRHAAVHAARELAAAQRSRVASLEQERERAARLHEQGRAARVVQLRAEAALSAARAGEASAAVALDAAERELARLMGVTPGIVRAATLPAAGVTTPAPDRDLVVRRALEANPELRRLDAAVTAARHGTREAGGQWWPRVALGGRYVRYASGAGDAGGEWQTGVQLQYPLFTGGARPAGADRARAELHAAEAELAVARLRIVEAVDDAWSALVSAAARAAAWRVAVEQNAEVARIERLALDTGAGVQTDYLAAEAELLRARAELTQAQAEELVARVELARVAGELSLEWIENNVESQS